jgi:tRNA threonylcarbamoyladenosine biosynthesis protein TsaE
MTHQKLNLAGIKNLAKDMNKKLGLDFRVFGLVGQLGAGKTTFTQALAAVMGAQKAKSPTFTVVNCYPGKTYTLYHIDLYRLDSFDQTRAIGLDEILADPQAAVVIEWADKFPEILNQCHAILAFEINKDQTRNVEIKHN